MATIPIIPDPSTADSIPTPNLQCELQIDGTATLIGRVDDLLAVLQEELTLPNDSTSLDFGREGWTLETQFASPQNLKAILEAIDRVLQKQSIPADDVSIVIEDESFPLLDLLEPMKSPW